MKIKMVFRVSERLGTYEQVVVDDGYRIVMGAYMCDTPHTRCPFCGGFTSDYEYLRHGCQHCDQLEYKPSEIAKLVVNLAKIKGSPPEVVGVAYLPNLIPAGSVPSADYSG